MNPCPPDPITGEPMCGGAGDWLLLGLLGPPLYTFYSTSTAQVPQSRAAQKPPGCFNVFLKGVGEAYWIPSGNVSTAFTLGGFAAVPAWSQAVNRAVGIRAAFGNFRVPAQYAAQAAKYFRLASTLEDLNIYAQVASFGAAGLEGLYDEWQAAESGACVGVF